MSAIKHYLVTLLSCLLLACSAEAVVIRFTWDYDFVVDRACTATVPTDCIKEFRLYDGTVLLETIQAPLVTRDHTFTRPYGNRSITVTAVSDLGVESVPSNIIVVLVRPAPPKALR